MNAIAAGLSSNIQSRIANVRRFTEENLIRTNEPEREGIDERIQRISVVESDFAANRRHSERVSVMRDAGDHAGEQRPISPAILRIVERSKTQTIERRNWTRARSEERRVGKAGSSGCG